MPDTGDLTLKALRDNGIDVVTIESLADMDFVDDVAVVRDACAPTSRFARVTRAAAELSGRPTIPIANMPSPATADCHGKVATSSRQPATLTRPGLGPSDRLRGQRVGGRVGDRVVDQHPERREADHSAQVDDGHENTDHHTEGDLGVVGYAVARVHSGQPGRQVPIPGRRQCGAPEPGDQGQQRTEAGSAPPAEQ